MDKVFKSGPSKTYGRHPLKNLKGYGLLKQLVQRPLLCSCRNIQNVQKCVMDVRKCLQSYPAVKVSYREAKKR